MLLHCRFNNRQAKTGAAGFAIACFIGTVERPENLFTIFRTHAWTIVINVYRDAGNIDGEADADMGVGIAQRIAYDIFQRTLDRKSVV